MPVSVTRLKEEDEEEEEEEDLRLKEYLFLGESVEAELGLSSSRF